MSATEPSCCTASVTLPAAIGAGLIRLFASFADDAAWLPSTTTAPVLQYEPQAFVMWARTRPAARRQSRELLGLGVGQPGHGRPTTRPISGSTVSVTGQGPAILMLSGGSSAPRHRGARH